MGKLGPTQPNKSGIGTANDVVMTPRVTAKWIIDHFAPEGAILEPCKGTGAFYDQFPEGQLTDWCEISEGKDFFDYKTKVDWIITNPPFSIFDRFLLHSFDIAENVVFFCPLNKVFKSMKIDGAIREYGGIKEVIHMGGGGRHGFPFGFPVGCIHYEKGYDGPINYTRQYDVDLRKQQPKLL